MAPRTIVVDACCTINLLATGREVAIAEGLDVTFLIGERAHDEVRCLHTPPDEDGARHKEPASTAKLRAAGRFEIRKLDSTALVDAFVACTKRLRDVDASCVALAGVLGVPLLTDDAKERRIALAEFPKLELMSTLDIVRRAVTTMGLPEAEALRIARDLRWRGNFMPPKFDPHTAWYLDLLRKAAVPFP